MKKIPELSAYQNLGLILMLLYSSATYSYNPIETLKSRDSSELECEEIEFNRFSNEGLLLHIANKVTTLNQVFFKAYLLKDEGINVRPSKSLYLEVLDTNGQVIIDQIHKLERGVTDGAIAFPKDATPGKYIFRAYTPKMLHRPFDQYVEQPIYLADPKTKSLPTATESLQIHIEGGALISGIENRVILYNPLHSPGSDSWKATILDENESLVSEVSLYKHRIGTALFTPESGKSYFVKDESGTMIPLPNTAEEGYSLQVNNLDSETAIVRIMRSKKGGKDSIWLSGHIGGKEFFKQPLQWDGNTAVFNIDKRLLPTGLLRLRLGEKANRSLASRPILIKNPKFQMTKKSLNESETSHTYRLTSLQSDKPTSSSLALSINKEDWSNVLLTNFHSAAEAPAKSSKSARAINRNQTRLNNFIQDLLVQIEYGDDPFNSRIKKHNPSLSPEIVDGIDFSAYVYDLNNKLLVDTPVQIYIKSEQGVSIMEVSSDSEGYINIQNLDFTGTAEFTFRTEGGDTKSRLVKAIPAEKEVTFNIPQAPQSRRKTQSKGTKSESTNFVTDTVGLIQLDEATVTDRRISLAKGIKSIYGIIIPGKRVIFQDHARPKSLAQLLMEMPGVSIKGIGGMDPKVSVPQGRGQVMWVIDGYMLPQDFDGSVLGYPINSIGPIRDFTNHTDIDRIDLLVGNDAAIYGSRGSGGVIVITTRTGGDVEYINRKDARLLVKGYEPKIDFKDYLQKLSRREQQRSTLLYWNPDLKTDENGEENVSIPSTINNKKLRFNYSISPKTTTSSR